MIGYEETRPYARASLAIGYVFRGPSLWGAMLDDMIGMNDMGLIFQVTDAMGIDRESISVPLGKEDPGDVRRLPTGEVEIVVPKSLRLEDWLTTLHFELAKLGFKAEDSE